MDFIDVHFPFFGCFYSLGKLQETSKVAVTQWAIGYIPKKRPMAMKNSMKHMGGG